MCSLDFRTTLQGSFRSWTSENAIPIVEKLLERTGTAFPLLKCLRTLYGRHCEPFSSQNALDCRTLHTKFQIFFLGVIYVPLDPAEVPPALGCRHQFPLGSPAFPLHLFYETTTATLYERFIIWTTLYVLHSHQQTAAVPVNRPTFDNSVELRTVTTKIAFRAECAITRRRSRCCWNTWRSSKDKYSFLCIFCPMLAQVSNLLAFAVIIVFRVFVLLTGFLSL